MLGNKEVVEHIDNGMLLSHKKWIKLINWSEVDEPKALTLCEGSKSERQKQILYINTYIWNLEK